MSEPSISQGIDLNGDRVDNDLCAIKGGGACQLREKVLAEAAKTWIIVADSRKNSQILGTTVRLLLDQAQRGDLTTRLVDPRYTYRGRAIRIRQGAHQPS